MSASHRRILSIGLERTEYPRVELHLAINLHVPHSVCLHCACQGSTSTLAARLLDGLLPYASDPHHEVRGVRISASQTPGYATTVSFHLRSYHSPFELGNLIGRILGYTTWAVDLQMIS